MALVVGYFEYTDTTNDDEGILSGFWSEPAITANATIDLQNMQAIIDTVENYLGSPYIWGNYTIVVMPPVFPMGAMENPLLSMISATTITGSDSIPQQAALVHSCAHMWLGNQVTMNNWEDFWLNEGFAVFVERHV